MCPGLPGTQTVVGQLLESILGYVRDTGAGLMKKGLGVSFWPFVKWNFNLFWKVTIKANCYSLLFILYLQLKLLNTCNPDLKCL